MIIVTGCAGFIGSSLSKELLKNNEQVMGVDILDNYYDPAIKKQNLLDLKKYKTFKFLRQDVKNIDKKIISDAEIVYHLAGIGGVRYSIENPRKYFIMNTATTYALLEKCRSSNIKKFVYASSSSVYGNVEETSLPIKESHNCVPISPYGCSKLAAEAYCMNFYSVYKLPTISLRYFTVYGPKQRPDEAICKFARKILKNEPIDIYGDGLQTRDFTYIKDIVAGTMLSGKSKIAGEIFNLGSGKRVALSQIVSNIETVLKKKATLNYVQPQSGDVSHTQADISKAKNLLGYQPEYDIEKGIMQYVEWIRNESHSL